MLAVGHILEDLGLLGPKVQARQQQDDQGKDALHGADSLNKWNGFVSGSNPGVVGGTP